MQISVEAFKLVELDLTLMVREGNPGSMNEGQHATVWVSLSLIFRTHFSNEHLQPLAQSEPGHQAEPAIVNRK